MTDQTKIKTTEEIINKYDNPIKWICISKTNRYEFINYLNKKWYPLEEHEKELSELKKDTNTISLLKDLVNNTKCTDFDYVNGSFLQELKVILSKLK